MDCYFPNKVMSCWAPSDRFVGPVCGFPVGEGSRLMAAALPVFRQPGIGRAQVKGPRHRTNGALSKRLIYI